MQNRCLIGGRLIENAIAKGKNTRVLLFTVITQQRTADKDSDIISMVPCAWFNPSAELEDRLTKTGKGQFIMFEGRINQSIYMVGQQSRCSCEVIVFPNSVVLDINAFQLPDTKEAKR